MATRPNAAFRRRPGFRLNVLALSVAMACSSAAVANPTGAQVVNGSASIAAVGNTLTITNSAGAIINWQSFSIGSNEVTRFIQPSAASSVLNRVVANNPSELLGQLTSNGRVFLINPAGILVGAGARIDTAGFVASTLNLSNSDFLAGRLNFVDGAGAGNVVNKGEIITPAGGSVYLVGANVSNEGIIRTPGGEALLAAGQSVRLIDTGTPGVSVEITGASGQATNLNEVSAEAGRVGIAGALVRQAGNISASSVVREGGKVFLKATGRTEVEGGRIDVSSGAAKGGRIEITGHDVVLKGNALLDASGATGGGQILVGGGYQGKDSSLLNARTTVVGEGVSLKADAVNSGNGGLVVAWADDKTTAKGSFSARGGLLGGDGGLIETSGRSVDFSGVRVDTGSPAGKFGTWLIDPYDLTIGSTEAATISSALNSSSVTLEATSTGCTGIVSCVPNDVNGNGFSDIFIASPIQRTATGGSATLTMNAEGNIEFISTGSISAPGNGMLDVQLNAGKSIIGGGGSNITTLGDVTLNATTGIRGIWAEFSLNAPKVSFLNTDTGAVRLWTTYGSAISVSGTNAATDGVVIFANNGLVIPAPVGITPGNISSGGDVQISAGTSLDISGTISAPADKTVYIGVFPRGGSPYPPQPMTIDGIYTPGTVDITSDEITRITAGKIVLGNDGNYNVPTYVSIGANGPTTIPAGKAVKIHSRGDIDWLVGDASPSYINGRLDLATDNGNVTVNRQIQSAAANSSLYVSANGSVNLNENISVGEGGTIDVRATGSINYFGNLTAAAGTVGLRGNWVLWSDTLNTTGSGAINGGSLSQIIVDGVSAPITSGGGNITLIADQVRVDGILSALGGDSSMDAVGGAGGTVVVQGNSVTLGASGKVYAYGGEGGGYMVGSTGGAGGTVRFDTTGMLTLEAGARVVANGGLPGYGGHAGGQGGTIELLSNGTVSIMGTGEPNLAKVMARGGECFMDCFGGPGGTGGTVTVRGSSVALGGIIDAGGGTSDYFDPVTQQGIAGGGAGSISVTATAGSITIGSSGEISAYGGDGASGGTSGTGGNGGNGGTITLSGAMGIVNDGYVSAAGGWGGDAGSSGMGGTGGVGGTVNVTATTGAITIGSTGSIEAYGGDGGIGGTDGTGGSGGHGGAITLSAGTGISNDGYVSAAGGEGGIASGSGMGGAGGTGGTVNVTATTGAITIGSTGSIEAYGGDGAGGDPNVTGGNGGSGGTITLSAGAGIANDGYVSAAGGWGGDASGLGNGGNGGAGGTVLLSGATGIANEGLISVDGGLEGYASSLALDGTPGTANTITFRSSAGGVTQTSGALEGYVRIGDNLGNVAGDVNIAADTSSSVMSWQGNVGGDVIINSSGPITIDAAGLKAGSIQLSSSIIQAASQVGTALDTSASNGQIWLLADNLGTATEPVSMKSGTGALKLDVPGSFSVRFDEALNSSKLSICEPSCGTISGGRDIHISTAAGFDMTIVPEVTAGVSQPYSVDGDNINLSSGGNIVFSGPQAGFTDAGSISLTAVGGIYAPGVIKALDTSAFGGNINLMAREIAGPSEGLTLNPGAGNVTARVTNGGMHLTQVSGDLSTSRYVLVNDAVGSNTHLTALAGNILVDGTAGFGITTQNDELNFSAPLGSIQQSAGAPLVALGLFAKAKSGISLTDAGNQLGEFTALNTTSGNISLVNTGNPLVLGGDSVNGLVNVTNQGGDISIQNYGEIVSDGTLNATGTINLLALGPITLNGAVTAAGVVLNAASSGGGNNNLAINSSITAGVGGISAYAGANITMAGGAALASSGDVDLTAGSNLTLGQISAGNGMVYLEATGGAISLTGPVTAGAGGLNANAGTDITAGSTTLSSGGDVIMMAGNTLTLGQINAGSGAVYLDAASGAINLNGPVTAGAGGISSYAGTDITMAGSATLSSGGDLGLIAGGNLTLGQITAGSGAIYLDAASGAINLNGPVTAGSGGFGANAGTSITMAASATLSSGGDVDLTAGTNLTLGQISAGSGAVYLDAASGAISLNGPVTAGIGGISANAGTDITMAGSASLQTSSGNVDLTAGNNIVLSQVNAGAGSVSLTATSGSVSAAAGTTVAAQSVTVRAATGVQIATAAQASDINSTSGLVVVQDTITGTLITNDPAVIEQIEEQANEAQEAVEQAVNASTTTATPFVNTIASPIPAAPAGPTPDPSQFAGSTIGGGTGEFGGTDTSTSSSTSKTSTSSSTESQKENQDKQASGNGNQKREGKNAPNKNMQCTS